MPRHKRVLWEPDVSPPEPLRRERHDRLPDRITVVTTVRLPGEPPRVRLRWHEDGKRRTRTVPRPGENSAALAGAEDPERAAVRMLAPYAHDAPDRRRGQGERHWRLTTRGDLPAPAFATLAPAALEPLPGTRSRSRRAQAARAEHGTPERGATNP